jgi:hypothetical protein
MFDAKIIKLILLVITFISLPVRKIVAQTAEEFDDTTTLEDVEMPVPSEPEQQEKCPEGLEWFLKGADLRGPEAAWKPHWMETLEKVAKIIKQLCPDACLEVRGVEDKTSYLPAALKKKPAGVQFWEESPEIARTFRADSRARAVIKRLRDLSVPTYQIIEGSPITSGEFRGAIITITSIDCPVKKAPEKVIIKHIKVKPKVVTCMEQLNITKDLTGDGKIDERDCRAVLMGPTGPKGPRGRAALKSIFIGTVSSGGNFGSPKNDYMIGISNCLTMGIRFLLLEWFTLSPYILLGHAGLLPGGEKPFHLGAGGELNFLVYKDRLRIDTGFDWSNYGLDLTEEGLKGYSETFSFQGAMAIRMVSSLFFKPFGKIGFGQKSDSKQKLYWAGGIGIIYEFET